MSPEYDNHHNAALCPHCNPILEDLLREERLKALSKARKVLEEAADRFKGINTGTARKKREGVMSVYDAIGRIIQEEGG